jgi:hypothetical protein
MDLKEILCGLDSCGAGLGEHGNEPSGYVKEGELGDWLSDC